MQTLEQLCLEIACGRRELAAWVERRWVKPVRQGDDLLFDEADAARARLIDELRHDMALDDEAIPVVLGLLDQLHLMRRTLARVCAALDEVAPEVTARLSDRLSRDPP
jgi:chaperone modulatory protein CbpM